MAPDPVKAAERHITAVLAALVPAGMVGDGTSVRLDALDTGTTWTLVLGVVPGPRLGVGGIWPSEGARPTHRIETADAARLTGLDGPARVMATLFGSTAQLEGWVNGTVPTEELEVEGPVEPLERLERVFRQADCAA